MIEPIDDDERQQLLRELLIERFGPIPTRGANRKTKKKSASKEEGAS